MTYSDSNNNQSNDYVIDPRVIEVDEKLYSLIGGVKILSAIKPLNYLEQKQAFFDSQFSVNPIFTYQKKTIDPFSLKRELYNLPLESLGDEDLYRLYQEVVGSYVDKIDQYKAIGTADFLYNSLRYYGEPSDKDLRNAQFILHLPDNSNASITDLLNAPQIKNILENMVAREGYDCEMVFDNDMIANALVSGTRININSNAKLSSTDAEALAHHELGVHLVTTLNARKQPLRILSMGFHLNTTTQEGLAILSEYLSGNLTILRLKILALRVIAVKSLIEDRNFRTTFLLLKENYHLDEELAFNITARVYRGGGFTKDYLYLKGLSAILNAYEEEPNFLHLLTGKTSISHLPMISRLIEKNYFAAPELITPAFREPVISSEIEKFIVEAIR
ncbi:MAG: hypothetical protein ACI84K_001759 [Pseudohongiellaceae bacterium]|jgi:uncharacterized protein (TIGR02421 family)